MRIENITIPQLERAYIETTPESVEQTVFLTNKIQLASFANRISSEQIIGLSVGIRMGLLLAEAARLEEIVGLK